MGETQELIADSGPLRLSRGDGVVGRIAELATIDRFLAADARALILEGQPGVGKSTLWQAGVDIARERGHDVHCARPAAVEGRLVLAGLRDLFEGTPREVRQQLPEVQQHALAVALAEVAEGTSRVEPGVLGVAVLDLLRELGGERPVLLAVDDLQWLDESTGAVLVYALRRLDESSVRLLACARSRPEASLPFALERALDAPSLVRLMLEPLSEGAIRRMLDVQLGMSLTRSQLHALYDATGGNPFYSLELARSGLELDGSGSIQLPLRLHEVAGARLGELPEQTRDALAFVAALPDPDQRILERLGVIHELEPALDAGVLEIDAERIGFAHPLIRAAAWEAVSPRRRREIHRTLADAVDDVEQRAHHLAAAAEPPDPETGAVLEQAAEIARMRGAPAAAADLLDRSRELTPTGDLDRWGRLATSAAEAHSDAGHWDSVWELVEQAQERLPAGPERGAILVTAAEMRPGLDDLLRQAAAEAGETAVGVRARIGLCQQAGLAGRLGEATEEARKAVEVARELGDPGLLGVALTELGATKLLDSQLEGRHELREALAIEQDLGGLPARVFQSPRIWQAIEMTFGDDPHGARALFEDRLAIDRERGDEVSSFQSAPILVLADLFSGDWTAAREAARATLDRVEGLGYEYARPIVLGSIARVEAYEGNITEARAIGIEALSTLTAFGDRFFTTFVLASLVFTELCAGNASAAVGHATEIVERFPGRECWWSYHQGDEIEALVLADERGRALERVSMLRAAGAELGLPRFLAWADRGEGLLKAAEGELEAATAKLEASIRQHERFPDPFERARTLLAYGHVLRRVSRRRAARATLGAALAEFERLGAQHFAAATRAELKHVGGRPPAGEHELTGAEDRIAQLVAGGLSNKEVAAELYLAVGTVEATLTRVYRKLGLTSRSQLASVLTARDAATGARRD